jgi:RNA polymerase sigma-70 factor (ECF subfamily)
MDDDERSFVVRTLQGDAEAFRALVERHSVFVFRLAFRITGNPQDAEDVVQESFLRAYRELRSFDQRSGFRTWLYRIAANYALDLLRARERRSGNPEPLMTLPCRAPTPERMALSGEIRGMLQNAMEELSHSERVAFVLRHFEGMGIEEVSRALGCQAGAAKHSVFRAVQKLRRALEPLASSASK